MLLVFEFSSAGVQQLFFYSFIRRTDFLGLNRREAHCEDDLGQMPARHGCFLRDVGLVDPGWSGLKPFTLHAAMILLGNSWVP
ncbi:hypothetical protein RB195_022985 [Necator americanus]|uniref:Secreted protein n=1 Tax=Necator americanus TaxID=51031 RepID=A0ABR1EHB8_NECAM